MLTISAVAEHKQIPVETIKTTVQRNTVGKEGIVTQFIMDIDLGTGLTQREKILLFNAARKCEVSEIVNGKFEFTFHLTNK